MVTLYFTLHCMEHSGCPGHISSATNYENFRYIQQLLLLLLLCKRILVLILLLLLFFNWPVFQSYGCVCPRQCLLTFWLFVLCSDMLREMILTFQNECIQIIVPVLRQAHNNFQENHMPGNNIGCVLVFTC